MIAKVEPIVRKPKVVYKLELFLDNDELDMAQIKTVMETYSYALTRLEAAKINS